MVALNAGTVETIPVRITDASGVLTTLDSADPAFSVYAYNVDGTIDHATIVADNLEAGNTDMTMQCIVDTTTGAGGGSDPWPLGRYAMLVTFTDGASDTPILGPIDIVVR